MPHFIGLEKRLHQAIQAALKSGATINGLAVAAGVPQPVVHRFAKKQQRLKLETADRLADYFGIAVSQPTRNVSRD